MCVFVTDLNGSGRLLLLLVAALALFFIHTVDCDGCGGGGSQVRWQILTKFNYSSQIGLHPRLLLLVTVPWSGESRALMKELAHVVASNEERFGSLKLMVLYRNVERVLADALGATDGITIFYHHNNVSYKYGGRLRVQNILSSMHYVMSLSPDELPLKSLTTMEELRDFLHSTDKAVLLLEFCGWTPRFMAMSNTMTESNSGKVHPGVDLNRKNNGTLALEEKDNEKDNKKGEEDEKLSCAINDESSGISWLSQFTSGNDSLVKEVQNLTFGTGETCTLYEFQQFEMSLQKLITVAREFFLPPERLRFAMVHDRSLLQLLNIEEVGSWMMTVYFAGCPSCLKVLKEDDDVRTVLQAQASPVLELDEDPQGIEAALPAKRPSILLFVDRSSSSMQIRRESQEALDAFRELAQQTVMSSRIREQATIMSVKTSLATNQASQGTLRHPRLRPFPVSQKNTIKDKMSIMIMNEGQQVTLENLVPDLQGSSLHEILTYVLKQKKELKLSSIAKDAGFQLLSKDFDIEVVESLSSHSEDLPNQILGEPQVRGGLESDDIDKKQIPPASSSRWHKGLPDPSDVENDMLEGREYSLDKSRLSFTEPQLDHHSTGIATDNPQGWNVDETRHSGMDENEQQKDFMGSFFFLDGQYRFLETLIGGSNIPSVVIIDPISQQHHVLAEQSVFSYSLLSVFVNDFLNGELLPYRQSAATVSSSRDARRPPFVNLDFHETDSIPLVATHTFAELVLGDISDSKNSGHSWNRNVLVLFSNSWCGFCQRMEVVVREVYRAVKSYANIKMNSARKEKVMPTDMWQSVVKMAH